MNRYDVIVKNTEEKTFLLTVDQEVNGSTT